MSGTTTTTGEIPLIASPQTFSISLAGVTYNMTLKYMSANAGTTGQATGVDSSNTNVFVDTNVLDGWVLDIADQNNDSIIAGIPLVPGVDLLAQYQYLDLGGMLTVAVDGDPNAVPDFAGLGTSGHLYFTVTAT